nr:PREDICTED: thyrotropin-releasing hormone receptor-like [Linepithema humile]
MDAEYDTIPKVVIYIRQYCIPIFLCLSLVGNSLSVCVLFCTKLRYHSSSIYLGALAMSDIGVLVTSFMLWLFFMEILLYEFWLTILFIGLRFLFCFLSVWIVVAFTVQRYIAIKWPLRRSLCTVNRAIITLIVLAGLAVLYSIPWFILFSILAYNLLPREYNTMKLWIISVSAIDTIITFVLPAIMIAIFNGLIMYNIRKHNRIQRNLILSSAASNKKTQSSDNEESHIEVTKMLVIISSLFICLNIPLQIGNADIYNLYPIGIFLNLISYGINFVLYSATGKNFRKELIRIFTKRSDST